MNVRDEQIFDVIVVGGGPAGLSAALILGRCRRNVLLIDAGQPRNAAAQAIHGLLGNDGITPRALLEKGRSEIERYGVACVQDVVISAACLAPRPKNIATCFRLETKGGRSLRCRKLLFATGMHDELPDIPGLRECYGLSVHHCPYCDGWEHRDQRIAVYAKKPHEAAGLAVALRGWSPEITVLTGGEALSPEDANRLSRGGIAVRAQAIGRLVHDQGQLRHIELRDGELVLADALFVETIQHPCCDLTKDLGVTCDEPFNARTSRKQKTNVGGVFLAGDADGDVQFVIVAAAEGATAAVAINRELLDEDAPPESP
jgi:thioredoxin reductase